MGCDLELIASFVYDERAYQQSLFKSLTHVFAGPWVIAVNNGSETRETLKKVGQDPLKGRINSIDVIIADVPVDGLLLLRRGRWVAHRYDERAAQGTGYVG